MDIIHKGENLLERWFRDRTTIDVEITVGHVWMTFTGAVRYFNNIELVLAHAEGELSISLCGRTGKVFEPTAEDASNPHWRKYRRTVLVETEGGASCTLHEHRSN